MTLPSITTFAYIAYIIFGRLTKAVILLLKLSDP